MTPLTSVINCGFVH